MYASDIAMAAASEALQIFGGWGYMGQYPNERLWRCTALQLRWFQRNSQAGDCPFFYFHNFDRGDKGMIKM
jgi:alkylation response protein AidB-like acyl-CoA dehydrogenase